MSEAQGASHLSSAVNEPKQNAGHMASGAGSEKDENYVMDAEDSHSGPSSQIPGNAAALVPSPFSARLESLEQREIQPNERDVDADFFSVLLVFYMMKEDWTKSSQCRLRAESTASNVTVNSLMLICQHLEAGNTGAALRLIKNSHFENPLKELLNELQKRIMLSVLRMVEHTYINIETKKLAEFLDIESDSELQEILDSIGWLQEDGYVVPKITPEFARQIEELNTSPNGPLPEAFARITHRMSRDAVDINMLIQYATFLEVNI